MSSLQVFTPAAVGRHFDFAGLVGQAAIIAQQTGIAQEPLSRLDKKLPQSAKLAGVTPASRLEVRPAPEMVSSGISEIDSLTGGLPRGCLTEICGPASSGRTSLLLAAMAAATQREEVCALVDVSDALNPQSAAAAGIHLQKMLWVRCAGVPRSPEGEKRDWTRAVSGELSAFSSQLSAERRKREKIADPSKKWVGEERKNHYGEFAALENALRVTDLLLQSSGFGMVVIDLGDISFRAARRVPLTSWFRFRRAVENTNTVLLVSSRQSCAQTCASLVLEMQASGTRLQASGVRVQDDNEQERLPAHAQLLQGLHIRTELLRSRVERKPVRSANIAFEIKTAWAG